MLQATERQRNGRLDENINKYDFYGLSSVRKQGWDDQPKLSHAAELNKIQGHVGRME